MRNLNWILIGLSILLFSGASPIRRQIVVRNSFKMSKKLFGVYQLTSAKALDRHGVKLSKINEMLPIGSLLISKGKLNFYFTDVREEGPVEVKLYSLPYKRRKGKYYINKIPPNVQSWLFSHLKNSNPRLAKRLNSMSLDNVKCTRRRLKQVQCDFVII